MRKTVPDQRPTRPWWDDAECRDAPDPMALFFPGRTTPGPLTIDERRHRRDVARSWCAVCPVLDDCAADADAYEDLGIRGGAMREQVGKFGATKTYRVTRLIDGAPADAPPGAQVIDDTDHAYRPGRPA